jgi:hypothetical protein
MECVIFTAICVVGLELDEVIMRFVREKIDFHCMIARAIIAGRLLGWDFGV